MFKSTQANYTIKAVSPLTCCYGESTFELSSVVIPNFRANVGL